MKNWKYTLILLLALVFTACQEDEPATMEAKVDIQDLTVNASYREADIRCKISTNATIQELVLEYSMLDTAFTNPQQAKMTKVNPKSDEPIYEVHIAPLAENMVYYMRARVVNKFTSCTSERKSFNTLAYELATIHTDSVTDVSISSAKLHGTLLKSGTDSVPQIGFYYAKHPDVKATDSCVLFPLLVNVDTVSYSLSIDNLEDNTTYYFRAFAKNCKGIAFGDEMQLTTQEVFMPTVSGVTVSNITYTTAVVSGAVLADGGAPVTERGIVYSTSAELATDGTKVSSFSGADEFSCSLVGLTADTKYYVCVFATNAKGTTYGQPKSFRTNAYGVPTVTTGQVTDITHNSAKVKGDVSSDGGQTVTERGICYSKNPNPTILYSYKVTSSGTTGGYTCALTGLDDGTTYYARAYAINSKGVAYGDDVTFETKAYSVPTVTTATVTNISYETATAGGNVTSDGDLTVTERGVCYSTSPTPTTEDTKVQAAENGTGEFTCNLTGLTNNTKYYVRAYAINSKGTAYGEDVSFTTVEFGKPVVVTEKVDGITAVSATAYGKVTADGGQDVTERGICFALTANPTVSDTKVASGLGIGQFTCNLTGLTEGTTYHVRAYATNSKGTSYGEDLTFVTTAYLIPTVTTSSITEITFTTAKAGGNVTSDGGQEVTEKGVCYATTAEPTIYNTKIPYSEGGLGAYTCQLVDLTPGTTYYLRAYATNSKGTSYGTARTFTTTAYNVPTVNTGSYSNVSYTTATCRGEITSNGGSAITEYGICYSTWHENPVIDHPEDMKTIVGTTDTIGEFFGNVKDLLPGWKCYYRAYAINSEGVAYGNSKTFTTTSGNLPTVVDSIPFDVTYTSAKISANVTNDGGMEVTERGICYSTTQYEPTIEDSKVVNGSGTGPFTCQLTDLQDGTTYYYRAYATNAVGTAYATHSYYKEYFTTKSYAIPTVTSKDYTNLSYTSVTVGGEVTADGGLTVTERGICISRTNSTPTIEVDSVLVCGDGIGEFSLDLTDLPDNTYFAYRAYAKNSKGVAYGQRRSFTTYTIPRPQVQTYDASDITYYTARLSGYAYSNNEHPILERGFCVSTSPNPTLDDTVILCDKSTSTDTWTYSHYAYTMTGLAPGTTYYVRAFGTNEFATTYGEEKSFTTVAYTVPDVTTNDPSIISFVSAVCGGKVNDDGGQDVTERGICYSTFPNPTIDNSKVNKGTGLGEFICALNNLDNNVTYYYRAYAINSVGAGYGEEKSFITTDYEMAVIYYEAPEKLPETDNWYTDGAVHISSFDVSLESHEFENGRGTIKFSDKITKIGDSAFRKCTTMTSVTIPSSVTYIYGQAYSGCTSLTSIDIPKNVEHIYYDAFKQCSSLTSINVAEDNTHYCDIDGVVFSKDKKTLIMYPCNKQGSDNYVIPNFVTEINSQAFWYCETLKSLTIPEGITRLPSSLCEGCSNLESVSIPNSVTDFSSYVFYKCTSLVSVTIPEDVTWLSEGAFSDCTGLTSITCYPLVPPSCSNASPFGNVNKSIPFYVPSASVSTYKNTYHFSEFTNIQAIP